MLFRLLFSGLCWLHGHQLQHEATKIEEKNVQKLHQLEVKASNVVYKITCPHFTSENQKNNFKKRIDDLTDNPLYRRSLPEALNADRFEKIIEELVALLPTHDPVKPPLAAVMLHFTLLKELQCQPRCLESWQQLRAWHDQFEKSATALDKTLKNQWLLNKTP